MPVAPINRRRRGRHSSAMGADRVPPVVDPNTCCGKPLGVAPGDPDLLLCMECLTSFPRPRCPLCDALADQRVPAVFKCPKCEAEGFACCVPGPLVTCLLCQEDESQ